MPVRQLIPRFERVFAVGKHQTLKWSAPDSIYKRLPEYYKQMNIDFRNRLPQAVHYKEKKDKYSVDHMTGHVKINQNTPLVCLYPYQSKLGLWGGEGVIPGYRRPKKQRGFTRPQHLTTKLWRPKVLKLLFYSEILNKYYALTCTRRTLNLIEAAKGFDSYILETHQVDLKSMIGMELKRNMLIALAKKEELLWPDNPEKQKVIYERYKKYEIPLEQAEWVGLRPEEAAKKLKRIETNKMLESIQPFKEKFAQDLIDSLKQLKLENKELPNINVEEIKKEGIIGKITGKLTGKSV